MATKRIYFLAHGGIVQGVGYRYFARRHATELGLTGWVQNLPNNKVEGEAQGDPENIASFVRLLDRGPSSAKVVRLDKEDREVVEAETEFSIRR